MFYSFSEISVMSRSHGNEIRNACRSCRKEKNSKKAHHNPLKLIAAAITAAVIK